MQPRAQALAEALSQPEWGPVVAREDASEHPLANAACRGHADPSGVWLAGGRIDALIAAAGRVLRTSSPDAVRLGLAQIRRALVTDALDVLHLVFAPATPRPLLLSRVQLRNRTAEPVVVSYSELWDIEGPPPHAADGACTTDTPEGPRALADVASVVRGHAPEPPPERGLALDLRFALPPGQRRELSFAYVAPRPGEDPAAIVRAWRGGVIEELVRTVARWTHELGPDPIAAYRHQFDSGARSR